MGFKFLNKYVFENPEGGDFKQEVTKEDGVRRCTVDRRIIATPQNWHYGACINFSVVEDYETYEVRNGVIFSDRKSKIVYDFTVYDENHDSLRSLFAALAAGDLRGSYGEEAVWSILQQSIQKDNSWYGKYFPKHLARLNRMKQQETEQEKLLKETEIQRVTEYARGG